MKEGGLRRGHPGWHMFLQLKAGMADSVLDGMFICLYASLVRLTPARGILSGSRGVPQDVVSWLCLCLSLCSFGPAAVSVFTHFVSCTPRAPLLSSAVSHSAV